jgi:hypothetical protein
MAESTVTVFSKGLSYGSTALRTQFRELQKPQSLVINKNFLQVPPCKLKYENLGCATDRPRLGAAAVALDGRSEGKTKANFKVKGNTPKQHRRSSSREQQHDSSKEGKGGRARAEETTPAMPRKSDQRAGPASQEANYDITTPKGILKAVRLFPIAVGLVWEGCHCSGMDPSNIWMC